jgi:hypothetical protein
VQQWLYLVEWLVEVILISTALALWEVVLEKNEGWASALNERGWGKRVLAGSLLARIFEKRYFTLYPLFMCRY